MTGNEHLINYKDYQEFLCNRCHSLICVITEKLFMGCQECCCMSSIKFDITSGRRTEKNNGKCKYP